MRGSCAFQAAGRNIRPHAYLIQPGPDVTDQAALPGLDTAGEGIVLQ